MSSSKGRTRECNSRPASSGGNWKVDSYSLILDNRMAWAEKVLREKVPQHEMKDALDVLMYKLKTAYWQPQSQIKPRLIAKNWTH